jgi:hypothetical protein
VISQAWYLRSKLREARARLRTGNCAEWKLPVAIGGSFRALRVEGRPQLSSKDKIFNRNAKETGKEAKNL